MKTGSNDRSTRVTSALEGRTAIVTGGGSGLGASISLALAEAGANVLVVGRSSATLASVVDAVKSCGRTAASYQADLADAVALDTLIAQLLRDLKGVDILIQNAAFCAYGEVEKASSADLDRHYCVNLRAPFMLTQAFLPLLKASHGQVVFLNSSAGSTAKANLSQYSASKHALKALADSLRSEVNEAGVRVLSVYLGQTATDMQARLHGDKNMKYRPERLLQPEDVAATILHALSLPSTAEITDIHIRPMRRPDSPDCDQS
jgi:NAD(P)-dependent dehydrogenase (short-subunit alcohol dehydrogenase family)